MKREYVYLRCTRPMTVVLIIVLAITTMACGRKGTLQKPNVIIIMTDDQGYQDVGCFGATDFKTPNLDRMASEGVRLTSFYAAQSVCTASRAGLMTGCYPNRIGIHGAYMPGTAYGLNFEETTIATMLRKNGYVTGLFGKWHLGDRPEFMPWNHGFDTYYGIPYSNDMWPLHPEHGTWIRFGPLPLYENREVIDTLSDQTMLTTWLTEKSVAFIKENRKQPFFLYLAHPQPHVPLFVSDKFKGKSEKGLYGDVMMEIDWSVGEILAALKKYRIDKNTLVIYTSDNGPWLRYGEHAGSAGPFREGKGTSFEGGQREPCIIRYPGTLKAGGRVDDPMMNIDILPTIAALTGSDLPPLKIDGKDIWELWTGESKKSPHKAYYFYGGRNELLGVRKGPWKLYFPHTYSSLNGRKGGTGGLPVKYERLTLEKTVLYKLDTDPGETRDVSGIHPQVVKEMLSLADEIREELGDRLQDIQGSGNRAPGFIEN